MADERCGEVAGGNLDRAGGSSGETGGSPSGDAIFTLMTWLSPAYPVGSYTYSHGLEWLVEDGTITTPATLMDWLSGVLRDGAGWSDALLLAEAYRAQSSRDTERLENVWDMALALCPSEERRLETTAQGAAFRRVTAASGWADLTALAGRRALPFPVAFGTAAAEAGLPLGPSIAAYLHAMISNLISAGVRLVPLGETDGQRTLLALKPIIEHCANAAAEAELDALYSASLLADIASMRHETQYTRLFRS